MDRIDDILFLYEDDRVEMADGGPITANKIPLKPVNKNINKKGQPDTTRVGYAKGDYVKLTPAERAAAYAKRSMPGKDIKDAKFKDLTDKIFKSGKFDLFKAEVTEAQKRFAAKTGKVRKGAGVIPAQYIKQFNKAIEAGVNSSEFKEILRITGRTEDEILELNKKRPGGKVTIKVRAKAAEESFPEDRRVSEADKKFKQKQIAKVRREREKAALKFASEADRQDLNAINKGKQSLNKFFKNNPEAINNTDFGKQIKAMMSLRFSKDGKISSKIRPDDYYVSKAKEGKLFDLFDVSPVAGEKRAIRFPTNLNITPGQFNQTFIQQVQKYFLKNDNPEALKEVDNIFKRYNIRVEIPGKGRIGAAADVAVDRSKGNFPRILNTLNSLKIPNKLKIPFIATGTIIGTAGAAAAADASEARSILPEVAAGTAAGSLAFKPVRQGVKKGLKATGRLLGKLAVPIGLGAEAYFAKQAYDEGKSIPEIMAAPFLLDSKVRQAQDMLRMKPEERQAVNREMIEEDFSGLSSDFDTPTLEGVDDVDIEEVKERVLQERLADEVRRREERKAGGGIAGLSGGIDEGPPPESGPNPQGLENLKYYVTNT